MSEILTIEKRRLDKASVVSTIFALIFAATGAYILCMRLINSPLNQAITTTLTAASFIPAFFIFYTILRGSIAQENIAFKEILTGSIFCSILLFIGWIAIYKYIHF